MISNEINNPLVKDLAWLVEGHYIEKDFDLGLYWVPDVKSALLKLDQDPRLLTKKIAACKSHFLGSYFETLFSFAIENLSSLTIVKEHFQIESEGKTLGEVDMLVETPDGHLHQFEIAIKFYLERPDLYPNNWIGPNKNDSLLKKVTRARYHQLKILQTDAGKELILPICCGRKVSSHLLIFGRQYLSINNELSIQELFVKNKYGGWINASNFEQLQIYFSHFCILKKPHWMTSVNLSNISSFFSLQYEYNPASEFLLDERPIHICLWSKSKLVGFYVFVVPDTW